MDLERIHQIIDWFSGSGLECFELSEGDARIRLERPAGPSRPGPEDSLPAVPVPNAEEDRPEPDAGDEVRVEAPIYGVCYLSSAPGAPPPVQPGQAVKAGDTLCIVEAMKVLNAIPAPCDGTVAEIVATDGTEVEQGQVLVVLK